jgi:hypothetical protein
MRRSPALFARRRGAWALALAALPVLGGGCGQDCCTVDSYPIPLARAPAGGDPAALGALMTSATAPSVAGGQPFPMVIDTAAPVTILSGTTGSTKIETARRAFDLLDALAVAPPPVPVRAHFNNIDVLDLPLTGLGGTPPLGVLGGDLLRAFSVEFRFAGPCPVNAPAADGCASVTFWPHLGTSAAFLQDAGYAALRFSLYGGGEVSAGGDPDLFGLRGPLQVQPSRVVLRACAAPRAFAPEDPPESCGTRACAVTRATGADLSLLVATGVGPLVLSAAAWARVSARLAAPPAMTAAPLLVATWPTPLPAQWTSIPRLALVDLEAGASNNPGPCVELGRARRIESVSFRQVQDPPLDACIEICDTDPRETALAQNSAAYVELGGSIPVAVLDGPDADRYLQALRFDIRPEGPEIDGLLGAAALGRSRLEIDYLNSPPRAVFSCDTSDTTLCRASARCPRLPDASYQHLCFGYKAQGLPPICAPSSCDPPPVAAQ